MEVAIVVAVISACTSVAVAIIGGVFTAQQNKQRKKNEEEIRINDARAEQRKKESLLAMEMTHANVQLTIGVAMALKRGYANGEIEKGLEMVNKASGKYDAYLRELANETLSS